MNFLSYMTLYALIFGSAYGFFSLSCGRQEYSECHIVSDNENETVIKCGHRTSVITKGKVGPKGENGETGAKGQDGTNGAEGPKGDIGATGAPGTNGEDGISVVFKTISSGSLCPNDGSIIFIAYDSNYSGSFEVDDTGIQSITVCNGLNGESTVKEDTNLTPVEILNPCGFQSNTDEVLLRLSDKTILASFSENPNGKNTRFSILFPGDYVTSDGTNCFFTISSDMNIIKEHIKK